MAEHEVGCTGLTTCEYGTHSDTVEMHLFFISFFKKNEILKPIVRRNEDDIFNAKNSFKMTLQPFITKIQK